MVRLVSLYEHSFTQRVSHATDLLLVVNDNAAKVKAAQQAQRDAASKASAAKKAKEIAKKKGTKSSKDELPPSLPVTNAETHLDPVTGQELKPVVRATNY